MYCAKISSTGHEQTTYLHYTTLHYTTLSVTNYTTTQLHTALLDLTTSQPLDPVDLDLDLDLTPKPNLSLEHRPRPKPSASHHADEIALHRITLLRGYRIESHPHPQRNSSRRIAPHRTSTPLIYLRISPKPYSSLSFTFFTHIAAFIPNSPLRSSRPRDCHHLTDRCPAVGRVVEYSFVGCISPHIKYAAQRDNN